MVQKFIIEVPDTGEGAGSIALKYDPLKEESIIGGNTRYSSIMSSYISDFFADEEYYTDTNNVGNYTFKWWMVGANKIKLRWKCSFEVFNYGIENMRKSSIHFKRVKTFGRIMR